MPQRQVYAAVGLLVIVALASRLVVLNEQQEQMQREIATLASSVESLQWQYQQRQEASAQVSPQPAAAPQVSLQPTVSATPEPPSSPQLVRSAGAAPPASMERSMPLQIGQRLPGDPARPLTLSRGSTGLQIDQCDGHRTSSGGPPLLVLGTTMGDANGDKLTHTITRNTLRGFMSQTPPDAVRPLVFIDNDALAKEILAETASVHPNVETTSSEFETIQGWPTFRSLMKNAEAAAVAAGAPFFGYSNGDLLFTEDLVVTLRLIKEALDSGEVFREGGLGSGRGKGLLIVGRRTNFEFAPYAGHLSHDVRMRLKPFVMS
eukprot:COSAG02_NODE_3333_length_6915_cov_4.111649_7_plen_319_part_00